MAPIRKEVIVKHKLGLNGERVNAKSIMGVMMLAVARGETVYLEAEGKDGAKACEQLSAFLEDGSAA
jgi:phosphotransferase system HPr (HPr) family protein